MRNKIFGLETLAATAERLRKRGRVIGATSGCFDILHAGHVSYLEEARARCDVLVVMLNSDRSVRALKGRCRPVVPQEERAVVLAALSCVDYVCIFDRETPCEAYAVLRPDVIMKGGDYRGKAIPEAELAPAWGGRVECMGESAGLSTTAIIARIQGLCEGGMEVRP